MTCWQTIKELFSRKDTLLDQFRETIAKEDEPLLLDNEVKEPRVKK